MRFSHAAAKTHAIFDDEHMIAYAGLEPVMRLAQRCGLDALVGEYVQIAGPAGANAPAKLASVIAGMACGADSIEDLDALRHGGMRKLFDGVRAPSTLGSFLRAPTWGNVRQLEKVNRRMLARLASHTPMLPDAGTVAFIDVDSMQRRTYGYRKQGSGFGHTKIQGKSVLVRGLNVLLATVSTPQAVPVICATRLRGGKTGSARGAEPFVRESIAAAKEAGAGSGAGGIVVLRGDSAFYSARVIAACRDNHVSFSVTAKMDKKIKAAIVAMPESAWVTIEYPNAVFDERAGRWVSDAEIAEITYTAFASKKNQAVTARLIVRRVKRLNPRGKNGQEELFATWRYHAIFTDSPFTLVQAEAQHRDHAVMEQVNADLIDGPLAHLPSGVFTANAAWLTLAALTHNLLRAAGCLAGAFHARARGATLRRHLIAVPARIARHGRGHLTLHLPEHWRWQDAWLNVFDALDGPPRRCVA
ncbi:IS1380 family transposase [Acrocarpospora pleiomorpha]|uniref:IS1380 family transposase n=1 Tax=Acrocarpospora pleiomorpha TaxID=90975 RepID=A0A5M3XA20_9ACTN|nr:IS1380 family transposase [Acrocarpospora pleiomorpha]GES17964.1 IS1380 family transposase [Acrocarpospora pleiomorpha]GES26855.1 IS1380 family transposase [Acrocarpospora pleiomorpha]